MAIIPLSHGTRQTFLEYFLWARDPFSSYFSEHSLTMHYGQNGQIFSYSRKLRRQKSIGNFTFNIYDMNFDTNISSETYSQSWKTSLMLVFTQNCDFHEIR